MEIHPFDVMKLAGLLLYTPRVVYSAGLTTAFGDGSSMLLKSQRQLGKHEKLDLSGEGISLQDGVKHAARIIHLAHDDNKDKEYELEMTWIGDESNGLHVPVPKDLFTEAETKAKEALENFA